MHSSQLLILGNGFDLHCGLKSAYKDFFQSTILDTIGEQFGLQQKKAGTFGFWETLLIEYYKKFGKVNYNWCDIETIIRDTVLTIGSTGFKLNALGSVRQGKDPECAVTIPNDPITEFLYQKCISIYYSFYYSFFQNKKNSLTS